MRLDKNGVSLEISAALVTVVMQMKRVQRLPASEAKLEKSNCISCDIQDVPRGMCQTSGGCSLC